MGKREEPEEGTAAAEGRQRDAGGGLRSAGVSGMGEECAGGRLAVN